MVVNIADQRQIELKRDFQNEIQGFIKKAGVPLDSSFRISKSPDASTVFVLTGVAYTPYDEEVHGHEESHSFSGYKNKNGKRFLMNNTAALLETLLTDGERVVVHTSNAAVTKEALSENGIDPNLFNVIDGDLADRGVIPKIYKSLNEMSNHKPIGDIRMALYHSFAQGQKDPFKPMHIEDCATVETAANRRLRFVYNMSAIGYDLLVNRDLEDLRIVSLSALAALRASYGLLADAADKYMNELAWKTFHIEANASLNKSVSLYQVNPGITTSCDTYQRAGVRELVERESIADGFPLSDDILRGEKNLPQISSDAVSNVVDRLLRTPISGDSNADLPDSIKELLYGGYDRGELGNLISSSIKVEDGDIYMDQNGALPDYVMRSGSMYGCLPKEIKLGDYHRISLCPLGQKF